MKLPNADQAIVDVAKLRNYCLSAEHTRGRNKARVFASALGLTADDASWLRSELLAGAKLSDVTYGIEDAYGQRYYVDVELIKNERRAKVRSAWIVGVHDPAPRLTTCFVLLKRGS